MPVVGIFNTHTNGYCSYAISLPLYYQNMPINDELSLLEGLGLDLSYSSMQRHLLLHPWLAGRLKIKKETLVLLISASFFLVVLMLISPVEYYLLNQKTYADGLGVENLSPASIGKSQLSLYVNTNPPILNTSTSHSAYMQFRLFDTRNNQTIQHVTYEITVTRGTASSKMQKPLLLGFFHAHNGLLTLHIEPTTGAQDPFLNPWVADPGGSKLIRAPLLLHVDLYHFHIEILTVDNDRNLFVNVSATYKNTFKHLFPSIRLSSDVVNKLKCLCVSR